MQMVDLEMRSREILGHLYDVAGVGMCVTDRDRRFVAVNRAYCETYGYQPSELLGNEFTMVVPPEERSVAARLHDEFLFEDKDEVSGEWRVVGKDGTIHTILVTAGRLRLEEHLYKITTVYDLTGRSIRVEAEQSRKDALKEVSHRVKNHLNSLQSMLDLQLEQSRGEETVVGMLTESINRIKSMSRLYDRLQRSTEIHSISLKDYLEALASDIVTTGGRGDAVELRLDIQDLQLTVEQATSFGLIINELVTNSLKHAIPRGSSGWISIAVKSAGSHIEAIVSDSGPGLPADYQSEDNDSLGMQIVHAIVGQHGGEFTLLDPVNSKFRVCLPRLV